MALLTRDAFINGHDLHRNYKQQFSNINAAPQLHSYVTKTTVARHRAIIFTLQFLFLFNLQFTAHVRYVCVQQWKYKIRFNAMYCIV